MTVMSVNQSFASYSHSASADGTCFHEMKNTVSKIDGRYVKKNIHGVMSAPLNSTTEGTLSYITKLTPAILNLGNLA